MRSLRSVAAVRGRLVTFAPCSVINFAVKKVCALRRVSTLEQQVALQAFEWSEYRHRSETRLYLPRRKALKLVGRGSVSSS